MCGRSHIPKELREIDESIYNTNYLFINIFVEIRFEYKCQHPEYGKDQVWAEINVIGADVKGIGVRNARNIRIILQTMAAVEDAVMLNIS